MQQSAAHGWKVYNDSKVYHNIVEPISLCIVQKLIKSSSEFLSIIKQESMHYTKKRNKITNKK